jgi:uncharacterized membrane protein YhaH (DUF805 family)
MEPHSLPAIRYSPFCFRTLASSWATNHRAACALPGAAPMDYAWYLFGFEGRLNRARLWLALLIILCWMIFLSALVVVFGLLSRTSTSFGFDIDDLFKLVDPASYRSLDSSRLPALLVKLAGTPVFLWVYVAVSVKRLHDRDRSGWWMVPFFVLPGLYRQFEDRLPDSYWLLPFGVASVVLCIWGFVEMYCLKGTRWPNRFGPNPLGKEQTARAGVARSSGRDQANDTEAVPYRASPPPGMHVKRGA